MSAAGAPGISVLPFVGVVLEVSTSFSGSDACESAVDVSGFSFFLHFEGASICSRLVVDAVNGRDRMFGKP